MITPKTRTEKKKPNPLHETLLHVRHAEVMVRAGAFLSKNPADHDIVEKMQKKTSSSANRASL
jgi:hypothetical protein